MLLANKLTEKLCREYDKYKSLYIAFDFDGTVQDYQTKQPILEVILLLEDLAKHGMKLILFTCGDRLEEKLAFCKENNIPVYAVNHNPDIDYGEGKPYFNVLLDDRAGGEQVYESLIELIYYIDEKSRSNSGETSTNT